MVNSTNNLLMPLLLCITLIFSLSCSDNPTCEEKFCPGFNEASLSIFWDSDDTLHYVSDRGNQVSFVVHGVQGTSPFTCQQCVDTDCGCQQAGGYRLASLDQALAMDVIRISQVPDSEKVEYRFSVFNVNDDAYQRTFYYHQIPTNIEELHQTDEYLASIDISNASYEGVIHSRISIMDRPDEISMQISDMWISFEYGLLQWYDSMQDETWSLIQ